MKRLIFILLAYSSIITAQTIQTYAAVETAVKPTIDGAIEELWNKGELKTNFIQLKPAINKNATMPIQVFFLYDEQNIYIAAKLFQPTERISAIKTKRDNTSTLDGDYFALYLDPLNNGNSAVFFISNPGNSVLDGTLDTTPEWNFAWDAAFESAVNIDKDAWYVEMAIPLSNISFQNSEKQDWRFFIERYYAQGQELSAIQLIDENAPYRITDFPRLTGLEGLKKNYSVLVAPYSFFSNKADFITNNSLSKWKFGGDFNYSLTPSSNLFVTINPDYAQIESDREIINVDDVPTAYPEKRPFFTSSSDLYPGLAVNTRNISDIKFGAKLRSISEITKYDLTAILEENNTFWMLGDGRITDNQTYYFDLIGGMKKTESGKDYNVTTNLRTWMFDKRLTAYTWFGTINSRRRDGNEWESVNSIRWITRNFNAGVWNHFKSQFYDPGVVGFGTLSNEVIYRGWIEYLSFNETGFWRKISPSIYAEYFDIYTNPGNGYLILRLWLNGTFHVSDYLGDWNMEFYYQLPTKNKFRFRNVSNISADNIFEDSYSKFALIDVQKTSIHLGIGSDLSKQFSGIIILNSMQVRGGDALQFMGQFNYRIASNFSLIYFGQFIDIKESPYQQKYSQTIHNVKFEYGIAERMTLRGVIQLNSMNLPLSEYDYSNPTVNLTFSWEYEPASFVHFVFNQLAVLEKNSGQLQAISKTYNQSIAIKFSKALGFCL
jgi:hypothetical protein